MHYHNRKNICRLGALLRGSELLLVGKDVLLDEHGDALRERAVGVQVDDV